MECVVRSKARVAALADSERFASYSYVVRFVWIVVLVIIRLFDLVGFLIRIRSMFIVSVVIVSRVPRIASQIMDIRLIIKVNGFLLIVRRSVRLVGSLRRSPGRFLRCLDSVVDLGIVRTYVALT